MRCAPSSSPTSATNWSPPSASGETIVSARSGNVARSDDKVSRTCSRSAGTSCATRSRWLVTPTTRCTALSSMACTRVSIHPVPSPSPIDDAWVAVGHDVVFLVRHEQGEPINPSTEIEVLHGELVPGMRHADALEHPLVVVDGGVRAPVFRMPDPHAFVRIRLEAQAQGVLEDEIHGDLPVNLGQIDELARPIRPRCDVSSACELDELEVGRRPSEAPDADADINEMFRLLGGACILGLHCKFSRWDGRASELAAVS